MSKVKKILSVVAAAAMIGTMFSFATITSSAYSGTITWEAPSDQWVKANGKAYAHIWNSISGEGIAQWQTKDEQMSKPDGRNYTYDVPEGDWNMIIISGDSGYQTYDCTMGADCIGDTIYATGETFENPVDSKKTATAAAWKNHTNYGPHKCISSLGKVIGTSLADGETDEDLYNAFYNGYKEGTSHPWENDGAIETGKSFDEILKEIRSALGLSESASNDDTSAAASESGDGDTSTAASTSTGGSTSTASTSTGGTTTSKASTSTSTSSTSTGTTTTGDSTPYIALGVILVAALGVAVVARKKVSE